VIDRRLALAEETDVKILVTGGGLQKVITTSVGARGKRSSQVCYPA
jgi:hypothetical protein